MKTQDMKVRERTDAQLDTSPSLDERLRVIRALHRGESSFVGFCRNRRNNGFENLFSVQIENVEAILSNEARWLAKDAYFTVNGMYRAAPYNLKLTGLPGVWRAEKRLKYLNACYVDLDVGREGQTLEWDDAFSRIVDLTSEGVLPQSSIIARSGRGCYAFWILHDDQNPDVPPRCSPQRLDIYKKINAAISKRLFGLQADTSAKDGARVLRVPGTRHGANGAEATYQVLHNGDGRPISHGIGELARLFGVHGARQYYSIIERSSDVEWIDEDEAARSFATETNAHSDQPRDGATRHPARANGARELNLQRAQDFVAVEQSRGGWVKGQRRHILWLYACFLKGAGHSRDEVLALITKMARNCQPPYPSDPNDTAPRTIVKQVFDASFRKVTNSYLIDLLGISSEEARDLGLKTLLTHEVKEERKPPKGGGRAIQGKARQAMIKGYIERNKFEKYSRRKIVELLKNDGVKSNAMTVGRDLKALGLSDTNTNSKADKKGDHTSLRHED